MMRKKELRSELENTSILPLLDALINQPSTEYSSKFHKDFNCLFLLKFDVKI